MKIGKRAIRRRRLLIVFWTAILLSTLLIVGQAFSTTPTYLTSNTGEASQALEFTGPETCKVCHSEEYDAWNVTGHALTYEHGYGPERTSSSRPDVYCYSCHGNSTNYITGTTVGQDLLGYTASNDPQYVGIDCEICHGPYDGSGGPGHMPVTLSAELCGECHSPYHGDGHGNAIEYWGLSGHATSQEKLGLIEGPIDNPYCMHCNTAEGAIAGPNMITTLTELPNGISCPACHDPHNTELVEEGADELEYDYQLREETVFELCESCHTHESETNPHYERLLPDGEEEVNCATCHMYGETFSRGRMRTLTNHSMTAGPISCGRDLGTNVTTCHANPEAAMEAAEELIDMGTANIASTEALVEDAFAVFMTANTTTGADATKLAEAAEVYTSLDDHIGEIGHAGTSAFHAPWYLEELLDEANMEAQELIYLSESAIELKVSEYEYGVQLLTVLGLAGALLIAVLRRRKL